MKYLIFILFPILFFAGKVKGQTPQYINYQAAVRNSSGALISDAAVTIRASILNGSATGEVLYSEAHSTGTTSNGLINLRIGSGTIEEGDFTTIDWGNDKKFLKIELKQGSSDFTLLGTQQLVSVPYALQAENTQAIAGRKVAATAPTNGKVLKWNGTAWAPATDANSTAPAGAAGGDLSGTYPNPTIGANKVTTAKINNAAVTSAKIANGAVTAAKLHAMGATNGQVLKYNGTAWAPDNNIAAWSLNGNATTATNFIGTTTALPLILKVNNHLAGSISPNSSNTSFGYQSLQNPSVGGNTAFGYRALYASTTGQQNTAIGIYALEDNTSGAGNVGIGHQALMANTSGYNNTAIGAQALRDNTTGIQNTAVGKFAFYDDIAYNNSAALGYASNITASNQIRLGNGAISSIGGYTGWTNVSDARFKKNIQENVPGLDFINKLRPVTYHLDMDAIARHHHTPDSLRVKEAETLKEAIGQSGFIAQEVEQAALASGYDFSGVDKPKSAEDYYGLRYAEFVVPLVKAVQEQQQLIEALQQTNTELLRRISALESHQ